MASQWGNNSLAPGASAGWFFARPNQRGFLPVPYLNELGVSTIWSQLSDDQSTLLWFMVVTNNSNNIVEYAFLENDL
jgi:hypothetical protein